MKKSNFLVMVLLLAGLSTFVGFTPVNGYTHPTKTKRYIDNPSRMTKEFRSSTLAPTTVNPLTYNYVMNMYYNMSNFEVRLLQRRLRAEGYYGPVVPTGYFGPSTQEAVIKFQREHGLPGTGYVGPQTRALLNQNL